MKTSSTTIRKFTAIVLGVYFCTLILIIGVSALSGTLALSSVGNALFYVGIAIFIFGFLFMGSTSAGDKWSGASKSLHMQSDAHFKEWRKRERPIELIAWATIFAAALITVTGYLSLYVANSGT